MVWGGAHSGADSAGGGAQAIAQSRAFPASRNKPLECITWADMPEVFLCTERPEETDWGHRGTCAPPPRQ